MRRRVIGAAHMPTDKTTEKATAAPDKPRGVWNEKTKRFILPSGTVRQGRRPMYEQTAPVKPAIVPADLAAWLAAPTKEIAMKEVFFAMNREQNTAALFEASCFEELQAIFRVGIGLPDGTPANAIGRCSDEAAFITKAAKGGTRVQSY